jgi:DNA modification methylase
LLGIKEVPAIRVEDLTEDQIRAYVIADNRLTELGRWDTQILGSELQYLLTVPNFDVTITGFEIQEIDGIVQEAQGTSDQDDELPWEQAGPIVTKPGDVWLLHEHRVICANSLREESYRTLLGRRRAAMVITDSPYNVPISGNVCGKGSIHHREFEMASGEMSVAEFIVFLTTIFRLLVKYSTEGSVHFHFMDWRHLQEIVTAGGQVYNSLLNLCVWVKDNGGMGSLYRSRHELVLVYRNGKEPHRNNVQLGRFGRYRTNVWEYPGINGLSKSGEEGNLLALHPTVKPVQLIADAILDCSARGDIVLDSFLGSGSTLIAAERVGRVCYGIEIDPQYVDVAIRRWQRRTGADAVHAVTGRTFAEIAQAMENENAQ